MSKEDTPGFLCHFDTLNDPKIDRKKLLSLEEMIVSIDAMGTQKENANQIRDKKTDYVLALKGNYSTLYADIRLVLETEVVKMDNSKITDFYEEIDKGHGRIEHRLCYVSDQIHWLEQQKQWRDLKTVIMLESRVSSGVHTTIEQRYFISNC